jgi:5-methylcytosine-specific restriction endonuclease McrA
MSLIKMQSYRCALTGKILTPEDAELDHKIPLSKGGTNQLGNLQWIAKEINKAKGSMTNEEFIAMCKRVATYTPQY